MLARGAQPPMRRVVCRSSGDTTALTLTRHNLNRPARRLGVHTQLVVVEQCPQRSCCGIATEFEALGFEHRRADGNWPGLHTKRATSDWWKRRPARERVCEKCILQYIFVFRSYYDSFIYPHTFSPTLCVCTSEDDRNRRDVRGPHDHLVRNHDADRDVALAAEPAPNCTIHATCRIEMVRFAMVSDATRINLREHCGRGPRAGSPSLGGECVTYEYEYAHYKLSSFLPSFLPSFLTSFLPSYAKLPLPSPLRTHSFSRTYVRYTWYLCMIE